MRIFQSRDDTLVEIGEDKKNGKYFWKSCSVPRIIVQTNTGDIRETRASPILNQLIQKGARV